MAAEQVGFSRVPWQLFLTVCIETLLTFYLATFCLCVYLNFKLSGETFTTVSMLLGYAFVLFCIVRRIIGKLPLATLMLVIPIAPLIALFTFITLIPVLEFFA